MTTLAAALLALAAPLRAQPAAAVSTATATPAAVSTATDVAESDALTSAVGLYDSALSDFRAGREDAGRDGLKKAFSEFVDGLDDDDLPAVLRPDFAAMIDKARNWPGAESQGPAAPDLDVPESTLRAAASTATVKMRGVRVDPDNPIAQKFIAIYTRQRPASVEAALARSGRYRDMIAAELKKKGLPPELLYLVMVESEYRPDVVSPSGAAGLWQFMPGTARKYGLEVSYWVDERYDPVKSTRAAARYLSDLYRWFGDWELALAAYNRGEGGIGRDLQYSRSLDFDGLSGRKALPAETDHYVPKFMACVLIGRDPAKYGLHPKYEAPEPYDEAILPRDLDLGVAAKCAGTTAAELHRLNPELRAWCTPKDRPGFALRLPPGTKAAFETALAKVTDWNPGPTMVRYKVRRGDSLGKIAKLYHTTVKGILANNKIRSARRLRPGMTLVIKPGRTHAPVKTPHRRQKRRR